MKSNFYFGTRGQPNPLKQAKLPKWTQVHGVLIAEVTHPNQDCGNVDGLWTRVADQAIAVVTADCVPILLSNKTHGIVAALHAGWRGTFQNIVQAFFSSLPKEFANPTDWNVVFGPSIRACCYEVSEELIQQFKEKFLDFDAKLIEPAMRKLDLLAINQEQLKVCGLLEHQIKIHPACTFCTRNEAGEFNYFSYRRGDRNSRQYSVIQWQK